MSNKHSPLDWKSAVRDFDWSAERTKRANAAVSARVRGGWL